MQFHVEPENLQSPPLILVDPSSLLKSTHLQSKATHLLFHTKEEKVLIQRVKRAATERSMASTSAVSMALPLTRATQTKVAPSSEAFFKPLPVKPLSAGSAVTRPNGKFQVKASSSFREKAVTGLTAAALTTSMMIPEVAQAADGVTPSLKNFLLSIAAGGVVVVAIIGAVIGVSNFDPVKRS